MPDLPVTYPAGVPSVSGTTYTLDWLLQDPKRVTRAIRNIALQGFYVDLIFAPAGDITGGAVIYEQATVNELYTTRDVQRVEPGTEFPIIGADQRVPRTAQVEKFGGKFPVTDEARRRNRQGPTMQLMQRLANTIRRKTQQRALFELQAAVTEHGRTAAGTAWRTDMTTAGNVATPSSLPGRDLAAINRANEELELGYDYDTAIFNPQEWESLQTIYGNAVDARAALRAYGITNVWVTNRKAAGTAYFLAAGQVGELGYEVPLSTETWRDKDGKQQNWYQSFVLPIVYVTDPFAILEITGLGA